MPVQVNPLNLSIQAGATIGNADFDFDGGTGDAWATDNSGIVTRSLVVVEGLKCTRMAIGANATTLANMSQVLLATTDLSTAHGLLRFRVNDVDATSSTVTGMIVRYTSALDASLSSPGVWARGNSRAKGWFDVPLTPNNLKTNGSGGSAGSAAKLAQVSKLWITPTFSSGWTGSIDFQLLRFWQPPARAKVMLRLDDGLATQFTRANEAMAQGIKVHIAIIYPLLGTGGNLTLAQALSLRDAGHLLLNHCSTIVSNAGGGAVNGWVTDTGGVNATAIAVKRTDVVTARNNMSANGMDRWARAVVVPGGQEGEGDRGLIEDGTIDSLWYTINGSAHHGTDNVYCWPPTPRQTRELTTSFLVDSPATSTTMLAALDVAIAEKTMIVFHGHSPVAADWQAFVAGIKSRVDAGTLEVATLANLTGGGPNLLPIKDASGNVLNLNW